MKILQVLVLIFGLSVFANAQKAILSGTVYDQKGEVISGTTITVQDKRGKVYEALSDKTGKYKIDLPYTIYETPEDIRTLPVSRYSLKATL